MTRPTALLLLTAITCVSAAPSAIAQGKPTAAAPFAQRTFTAAKQTTAKTKALTTATQQKIDAAFAGEDKVKAAMQADIKAIRAEKNPTARASLAAAFNAKYQKDSQRILGKANIDTPATLAQLRAANPGMTFKVVGSSVSGTTVTAQSQPSPARPPASLDTVKDLTTPDYTFLEDTDCPDGWGGTTRSGGYVTSKAEGCQTSGMMWHEFEVPADRNGRIEVSANLKSEAHTIGSSAWSGSDIRLIRLSDDRELDVVKVGASANNPIMGDDSEQNLDGATIVRDLQPGRYRIEAYSNAYSSQMTIAWAVAESRIQALRVKIITSPK